MTAIAHFIAITCYIGAAALAATPFARPVGAPVRGVAALLAAGVLAHAAALLAFVQRVGQLPLTGLGPSLSFAGLVLAATLLVVELAAQRREPHARRRRPSRRSPTIVRQPDRARSPASSRRARAARGWSRTSR